VKPDIHPRCRHKGCNNYVLLEHSSECAECFGRRMARWRNDLVEGRRGAIFFCKIADDGTGGECDSRTKPEDFWTGEEDADE